MLLEHLGNTGLVCSFFRGTDESSRRKLHTHVSRLGAQCMVVPSVTKLDDQVPMFKKTPNCLYGSLDRTHKPDTLVFQHFPGTWVPSKCFQGGHSPVGPPLMCAGRWRHWSHCNARRFFPPANHGSFVQDLFNKPVFPEIETFTYHLYNFQLYLISPVPLFPYFFPLIMGHIFTYILS